MTIRDNSNNNKSFASAPTTETNAVAFNVNADDVFNEDNIPFAHASSVSTSAANSGYGQLNNNAGATTTTNAAQTTPIAYSTGKPPQPPPPQPRSSSSSVAVATGAPTPTPTSATQTTSTTTTSTLGNSRRNNSSECCTGWNTCGGITCIVLSCFCICCFLLIIIGIIMSIDFAAKYDYDDDSYNLADVDYYNNNP